jgi:hypothetical protein
VDMRLLGQRGGLKSGEVRRAKRLMRLLGLSAPAREIKLDATVPHVEPVERPNRSGGSHDTDWRCPYCRRFNSIKRRSCANAKCGRTPANGRLTRARLREQEAWHRNQAMLKKHGL